MIGEGDRPRALFYSGSDRPLLPDHQVCSGQVPSSLNGKPCPYSVAGRIPEPVVISEAQSEAHPEIGEAGDLAPSCAVRHFGSLGDWLGPNASGFPEEVLASRLFECRQWFLLVVPWLRDSPADPGGGTSEDG
jgi:hypothetical protein